MERWKWHLADSNDNKVSDAKENAITIHCPTPHHIIYNVYELPSTNKSFSTYVHHSKWIKAINHGNLAIFPGLTIEVINEFFPESDETQKGYTKQHWQNITSTKSQLVTADIDNYMPSTGVKYGDIQLWVYDRTKKAIYTSNRPFPCILRLCNNYRMVAVELDDNYSDAKPLKSRSTQDLIKVYQAIWSQ